MLALAVATAAGAETPRARAGKAAAGAPAGIGISYAELIDPEAVTRDGRKLGEALRDKGTPRAFLQPFLDGYSSLLPYAVEMVFGPDPVPRRDVVERWPPGSAQPGWVALFRGRYRAVADADGKVRLFLPGDDAAEAWRKHYPVVRHCLTALAGETGSPLAVEVFAYRNDYRKQELRLSLRPATVAGAAFPPDRAALDVTALDDFFRPGVQLEGAQLDPAEGLVLFANPEKRDALGAEPVSLADLAVAYRAVFHAGDNDAFISLDPNADPARATVNFGGHLEDTRIGAAVLAADRRFKTVCTGLDPVTHQDARAEIRKRIPEFMTNSERAFLERESGPTAAWVASRYWFYPESVSVETDPQEGFAVITRPRFTADAERIGEGFEGLDARKKRAALPAGARENIRQINAEYERYAQVFPEIGDLAAVARLMAVATWLRRSETAWLDLDALLAVPLPAVSTPRTLERIVSTEYVAFPPGSTPSEAAIKERSEVSLLNPMLQRPVGEFFRDARTYTGYLCTARKEERRPCSSYEAEAASLFEEQRGRPLSSLLRTEKDLLSLLEFLMKKIVYPLPPEGEAARAGQVADGKRLEQIRADLERVRAASAAGGADAESLEADRVRLEAEFAAIMKRYHEGGQAAEAWQTRSRIQINGGISLRPTEFTIRKNPESKAMREFKRQAQSATVAAGKGGGGGRLVRSRPTGKAAPVAAKGGRKTPPAKAATSGTAGSAVKSTPPPDAAAKGATPARSPATGAPGAPAAPAAKRAPAGTPPSAEKAASPAKPADAAAVQSAPAQSAPPAAKTEPSRAPSLVASQISVPAGAAGATKAVGELTADGRIVFRKAP
jgi:hypothetical protein